MTDNLALQQAKQCLNVTKFQILMNKKNKIIPPSNAAEFLRQQPFDLRQRFRNLGDPLQFIESDKIRGLQQACSEQKGRLRNLLDQRSDFSKAIYKKVVSQNNNFRFAEKLVRKNGEDMVERYNNRFEGGDSIPKVFLQKGKKQHLERQFKHGDYTTLSQKKDKLRESRQIPLTFAHVKLIGTPEFEQLKNVQFYSLLKSEPDQKEQLQQGVQINNRSIQNHVEKHQLIHCSQYQSEKLRSLFDCDRELKFWRIYNMFEYQKQSEEDVISACAFLDPAHISLSQMFEFSSRNIEIADLVKFYHLKGQLKAKFEMNSTNENMQEKYNKAKKRFQELKETRLKSKIQRMRVKFVSNEAQTNDQMSEKDFEDYFTQNASAILEKITQLNATRDKMVEEEEGQTFLVMATNIAIEIGEELFKLLILVLKGEKFQIFSRIMKAQSKQEVERKILQLIYLQFSNFTALEVDGTSKVEMVKTFLDQRQKNERFYQTYQLKRDKHDRTRI